MESSQLRSTLSISDQDLQSTLQDFLEEKEKKPEKNSIWNVSTLTGLGLILITAMYAGYAIGTEVFGFGSLPFMNTLLTFTPYLGGAFLGVRLLSMFKSKKKEKQEKEQQEEAKIQETYDKLDKFLYDEQDQKRGKTAFGKGTSSKQHAVKFNTAQKLMKSRTDKKLAGVCGGLAKHLGISSTIVRLIFVAALFLSFSSFVLLYIALAIVMPKEPVDFMDDFK